jgi:hypothetical protein
MDVLNDVLVLVLQTKIEDTKGRRNILYSDFGAKNTKITRLVEKGMIKET